MISGRPISLFYRGRNRPKEKDVPQTHRELRYSQEESKCKETQRKTLGLSFSERIKQLLLFLWKS